MEQSPFYGVFIGFEDFIFAKFTLSEKRNVNKTMPCLERRLYSHNIPLFIHVFP